MVLAVSGDGQFTRNVYDAKGNLVSTIDPFSRTTAYAYNTLDQAVTQTLPDGTVTSFTYDAAGNLLTRGMAAGALTHEQTYDNAGRKLTERLYSGGTNTRQFGYSYYPLGNAWVGLLQTVTAPRDTATTTYDDFLRPQTVTTSGSLAETNGTTTYAYDRRNLVTSISQSSTGDAAGPATQVSRAYDGYGQMLTETVAVAGTAASSVTQTWDAAGRRASLNEAGSTRPAPLFAYQHRADGLLAQVTANNQNYGFAYGDNGLIASRTDAFRSFSVNTRDAAGRLLQQTSTVGATPAIAESMTWRVDGTLDTYTVTRGGTGAWNEARAYAYNSRGQLVSEGYAPAAGASGTLSYLFDGNNPGLGVRTDAKGGGGAPLSWESRAAAIDALARVTQDQMNPAGRVIPASGVSLGADHVDILVDGIAQGRARHPGWADPVGAWSIDLSLSSGQHTLSANAVHPSGQYTATATSTFTVAGGGGSGQAGNVVNAYDDDGNVISRTWDSGLIQSLTWDAFGRLIKVAQRDAANSGYDWAAVYDGLGRRLKTTQQPVTANAPSGSAATTSSIYDPQVEFLEIGVAVNGVQAWKVYGPDLNGRFGGLQGTGGLEAVIVDADGTTTGVINDQFGNGVATVSGGTVTWNTTRVGAYGPLPGIQAQTLTDVSQLAAATAWRSRRIDPTGFYYLGARYYEPTSGRFLSADPMGHASSPSLYDYAGGDPVNRFDRDGRDPAFTPDMPNIFSGLTPTQEIEASRKAEKTAPIVIAGAVIIFAAPEVGALATTAAGLKLLGIAAGAGVGAAIVGTAGADAWNGKLSSWQTYTSNAFGGGAGGVVTVATGSPLLGGAFSGDVSTLLDDLTNGRGYNPDRATFNTGLGGLAGKATDWFAPYTLDGINSGSNSLESISHQIATKTLNGTIEDFSYATATKIGIYETIINLPKASAAGGLQGYLDSQLFKENTYVQQDPTGKHTKLR